MGVTVDRERCEVSRDGSIIQLTRRELLLLIELGKQPGKVMEREYLLDATSKSGYNGDSTVRTIDVHVARLRRKLGRDVVETVPCFGYRSGNFTVRG